MPSFKIGVNMAGAVSAGAYTAGVLDFLTEALDAWYKAKANGEAVPMHDVSLEVFTGASAGGMCAAISSVLLQQDFQHIHETSEVDSNGNVVLDSNEKPVPLQNTTNLLYESWVNRIDIRPLLSTDDLKPGRAVVSLLNSGIIQQIAQYALNPPATLKNPPRPWVSSNLSLVLALTNLRGIPYSLNATAPGSLEETTFFYGARIGFQTVRSGPSGILQTGLFKDFAHAIDLEKAGVPGGWDILQTAAMATGAFPLFLQPRVLQRYTSEFIPPHWLSVMPEPQPPCGQVPPAHTALAAALKPNFPEGFPQPFTTLNVDGGITNNDPYNYAHDYLAALEPQTDNVNPRDPRHADRAVINIAPFPTVEAFDPCFDVEKESSVFSALSGLFSALISQSRFYGESLGNVMDGTTFSRFIIAPSDDQLVGKYPVGKQPPALQCASLGAFGGFLEREFRAHDYKLGRRNCQKFLSDSFVLPVGNPIIDAGLPKAGSAERKKVIDAFPCKAPGNYEFTGKQMAERNIPLPAGQAEAGNVWLPIVPLVHDLSVPLPEVKRAQITLDSVDAIVNLMRRRYLKVVNSFIGLIPNPGFQFFLYVGQPIISRCIAGLLRSALIENLGDSCEPET